MVVLPEPPRLFQRESSIRYLETVRVHLGIQHTTHNPGRGLHDNLSLCHYKLA